LTASVCYKSPVNLSCGSDHPPTCTPLPATATPTAGGAAFSVTVSSTVDQTYNFNIVGVGTDPLQLQRQQPVTFTSGPPPPFSFAITPSLISPILAGQTATYTIDVKPSSGTFPNDVTLALLDPSKCPPLSTCSFQYPVGNSVGKGSGDTHVTLTITTTAPVIAAAHSPRALGPLIYALWFSLPGLIVVCGLGQPRRSRKRFVLFLLLTLVVPGLWLEIACSGGLQGNGTGGNGQPGTPPGTYPMTVSATMTGLPPVNAPVTLTVN